MVPQPPLTRPRAPSGSGALSSILIKLNAKRPHARLRPAGPGGDRVTEFLTALQAAQRLGVKPATLYAYVSRGVLHRDRAPDGRGSLFDSEEVERLARRGRPRRPAGVADITGDRLRSRGLDATRLATTQTFENVADLLWTGEFPTPSPAPSPARAAAPAPPHIPSPSQAPASP